ncbi:MAG TPA: type II toxin-antitoxin system PrlF family antitoxin [Methyloceanibacter sp.]|nr:type II toxin-antitoxin system PrlF family antitoxin [Methyloceanibacter sp.]
MIRAFSKLTAKSQTTVPKKVREALQLQPGDAVVYEVQGTEVRLSKLPKADATYLRALQQTLSEWDSAEDTAAFDDL